MISTYFMRTLMIDWSERRESKLPKVFPVLMLKNCSIEFAASFVGLWKKSYDSKCLIPTPLSREQKWSSLHPATYPPLPSLLWFSHSFWYTSVLWFDTEQDPCVSSASQYHQHSLLSKSFLIATTTMIALSWSNITFYMLPSWSLWQGTFNLHGLALFLVEWK